MLIEVTVEGISGLMLDAFTNELLEKGAKSAQKHHAQQEEPVEQAKKRLYLDDKGIPVFPADNLLKCLIEAGRLVKVGKRQLSTRDTTIVTTMLAINEMFMPINSKDGWRVSAKPIVNQVTKGRHLAYRPIFDDWRLFFTLDVDLDECSTQTIRELVDRAGKSIGIGVMRPSRRGSLGRFKVVRWVEHEEPKKTVPQARGRNTGSTKVGDLHA